FREVVIHPRCTNVISEFRLYSYKTDRLSGDVLPVLVDANNHWVDALRYALEPIMKARKVAPIAFKWSN
ncbi:MAG: terminase large subunit, partial [Marinomonas gallaica]